MTDHSLRFESRYRKRGYHLIAGVDEAGRGPLAGPVVAAAVILPYRRNIPEGIRDSKQLSPRKRINLFYRIRHAALAWGVGVISHSVIDDINIRNAALKAMNLAVLRLQPAPDFILVDGCDCLEHAIPQLPITGGDRLSLSVSAASIIAKVTRDRIMASYHRKYPDYNFIDNKGYGTAEHRKRILLRGRCPIHRQSFRLSEEKKGTAGTTTAG